MLPYFSRIGIALSILLNVVLGGPSNQTFSARNYQRKRDGKVHLVGIIDALYFLQPDHCLHSWSYWVVRVHVEE